MNFFVGLIYYTISFILGIVLLFFIALAFEKYTLISFIIVIIGVWVFILHLFRYEIEGKGENIIRFLKGE